MPKGVSGKGYKMTANRRAILNLLVEEGGSIKSGDGKATSLMHGLLESSASMVSFLASLRELENIGLIERDLDGRRTYEVSITPEGRKALGLDEEDVPPAVEAPEQTLVEPTGDFEADDAAATANGSSIPEVSVAPAAVPVPETEWDWTQDGHQPEVPGDIDYDMLLRVFIKAALRGLEGPSNTEVDYYKQQADLATERIALLEHEIDKLRTEAASAISERDQLQQNLNVLMARFEKKPARGANSIRSMLSPEERSALDTLMRQVPSRRGE